MNEREILTAALRWHAAHVHRLEIGAEQRRYQAAEKQRTGFGGSDYEISQRLTAAKRPELAALRNLAKVCTSVRGSQKHVADADVIDAPSPHIHRPKESLLALVSSGVVSDSHPQNQCSRR